MNIGDVFTNNAGQEFVILSTQLVLRKCGRGYHKKAVVKFFETGTTKEAYFENIKAGKVRDDYAISCYGVGCLGNRDKSVPYYIQANQLWRNMLKRCYSDKDPKGYKGAVIVCKRWLCLENFVNDLPKLKNFDKWLEGGTCSKTRYQLDKDILGDGTVYSPHVCMFVTENENKRLGAINARAWDARMGGVKPDHKVLDRDLVKS